jgi:lambda family phage minor tail protein L
MAVAAWAASTAYSLGDIKRATTAQVTGLFFKVTAVSGSSPYTSGSTEPKWGTDIGSTVIDNELTWTAISSTYEELSGLGPNTIIELFELHLDATLHGASTVYRWHNGVNEAVTGDIVWNSQTYTRQPIEATGFSYNSGGGTLPRPTLSIGNIGESVLANYLKVAEISALLLLVNETTPGNDLGGATVKRIKTLKKFLDGESGADPNCEFPQEIYIVDRKASENRHAVSFELASVFDLPGVYLPRRQVVASVCQWAYRSSECSYTGNEYFDVNDNNVSSASDDVCGKRLSSCKMRFGANNLLPFGGFPGAGQIK